MAKRQQGRVTEWRDEQGYGFVTPDGGGDRVFLHIKALPPGSPRPAVNDEVKYRLSQDERGRPRAADAVLASVSARHRRRSADMLLIATAAVFLVLLGGLVSAGRFPAALLYWYLGLSVVAYGLYAMDKSAAIQGRWRTAEKTLLTLGLLGGWPGALIAQQRLRHKSSKRSFQVAFWVTVVLNVMALGWLLTADGSRALTTWTSELSRVISSRP